MPEATAVASDWLRPRLGRAWRSGVVVGVTPRAAYVAVGSSGSTARSSGCSVLAVETAHAVGLPNGVIVADPDLVVRLAVGQVLSVSGRGLETPGWSVGIRRWERSRPVLGPGGPSTVRARLTGLGVTPVRPVPRDWPDPDERLVTGAGSLAGTLVEPVRDGRVRALLDELVGYGPGSTPAGDDVVASVVATATVLGRAWGWPMPGLARVVAATREMAERRTTGLSATLLACAGDGAMARPAAGLLVALTASPVSTDDPTDALARLARVGHTSGRDLALGMLATTWLLAGRGPDGVPGRSGRPRTPGEVAVTAGRGPDGVPGRLGGRERRGRWR